MAVGDGLLNLRQTAHAHFGTVWVAAGYENLRRRDRTAVNVVTCGAAIAQRCAAERAIWGELYRMASMQSTAAALAVPFEFKFKFAAIPGPPCPAHTSTTNGKRRLEATRAIAQGSRASEGGSRLHSLLLHLQDDRDKAIARF